MALLKCSECGQMVSENAKSCPNCGNPIKAKRKGDWQKPIFIVAILLLVMGGAYGVRQLIGKDNSKEVIITDALSEAVHRYSNIGNFHEGMAAVCRNEMWGYINSDGEEVIPCKYAAAFDFSEGLACVFVSENDCQIEFIDHKGNSIVKGYYGDCLNFEEFYFRNGISKVRDKDGKELWIDKKGNVVETPQDANAYKKSAKSYTFEENGKHGIKDTLNNIIVIAKYSNILDFSEGLAVAYLYNGQTVCGYVDKNGHDTFTKEDWERLSLYEERQRAEAQREIEERQRQTEIIRREGVEKIVSITVIRSENKDIASVSGSYGAIYYKGYSAYDEHVITKYIKVPEGKVWIYKKNEIQEGGFWSPWLLYYSNGNRGSGVNDYNKDYRLSDGDTPILRGGDGFRIATKSSLSSRNATLNVYFIREFTL